jgi:2-polyprenyl-3-methyl-5-hydroxy-6-metoxy-1,4-benzoquinol methylase
VNVFTGQLHEAPFEAASFDYIHLNHVIEHLPDPVAVLRLTARLLKPGGLLFVATPNVASFNCWRSQQFWPHWDSPRHLCIFSPETLSRAVRDAGIRVTKLSTATQSLYEWEATYRREERLQCQLPSRPCRAISTRMKTKLVNVSAEFANLLSPLSGDELRCWATT